MTFELGVRLGPYEILSPLKVAGVAELYLGRDEAHDRYVVIRVLRVDFATDPVLRRRFEYDAGAAAALVHPNILQIYDVGADARAAYIVSEPFVGETLRQLLDRRAVSMRAGIRCLIQMARALAAARTKGIAHRDLRPENVLVAPEGTVTILGFGLAELTRADAPVNAAAGHRSDLFALAAILGEVIAGLPGRAVVPPQRRRLAWMAGVCVLAVAAGVALPTFQTTRDAVDEPTTSAAPRRGAAPALSADRPAELVPQSPTESKGRGLIEEVAVPAAASVAVDDIPAAVGAPSRVEAFPPARDAVPGPATGVAVDRTVPLAGAAVAVAELPPVFERDDREATSLAMEASVRTTEFDMAGASKLLRMAVERGDPGAQVASLYVNGLQDAREAFRDGGTAESLAPVQEAIESLEAIAKGRRSSAEIARLMLQAAGAAAQSERDEMRLYLETAIQMESLQRVAGLPGAPLVTAAEMAGDLWLQVGRFDDARRAYSEAAERVGSTLRILAGLARSARRLKDVAAACTAYRSLLDTWAARPGLPVEIVEARAYVGGVCASAGP